MRGSATCSLKGEVIHEEWRRSEFSAQPRRNCTEGGMWNPEEKMRAQIEAGCIRMRYREMEFGWSEEARTEGA